jgi:hypothetical protein
MPRRLTLVLAAVLALPVMAAAAEAPIRIDDFEDLDLESASGLSWIAFGDWLVGGTSSGNVTPIRLPAGERSRGALRIEGQLGSPERTFAGAWTALRGDGTGADLTGYRAVRFRARGTPGRYTVGVRRSDGTSAQTWLAPVSIGAGWADLEVDFGDLADAHPATPGQRFSPTGVSWLGFASHDESPREFRIDVDDVEIVPVEPDPAPAWAMRKHALADARELAGLSFVTLAREAAGDGVSRTLPDARELAVAVDRPRGLVWFRVTLDAAPPAAWLGINVALDVDGDPANGRAWWGQNKAFRFDRLVTAYLSKGDGYWQGIAAIGDAAGAAVGRLDGIPGDVRVVVDRARRAIAVGVPRDALGLRGPARVIATVGSSMTFNDDLPQEGALEVVIPPAVP